MKLPKIELSDINGFPIYKVKIPMDAVIQIQFTDGCLVKPFTVNVDVRDEYHYKQANEIEELKRENSILRGICIYPRSEESNDKAIEKELQYKDELY